MAKFKVGDKVRVVRNNGDDFDGIKIGDTGEVVEICKEKYPIYLKINNHYEYGFKEEELELFEGVKEVKELTFKEVIANIKEGEVWENEIAPISFIRLRADGVLDFNENEGINLNCTYKLKRKEFTFEEAFKAYKEGRNPESAINGQILDSHSRIDMKIIEGKWYIND